MKRPLAISLSPNTQRDDVNLAFKSLFIFSFWLGKKNFASLDNWFSNFFGGNVFSISTNSGRSAMYLILKSMDVGEDDEVILQAFTCIAVPNSIIWNGAKPIYVDIDETFNIDPKSLESRITSHTKAVIIQHTFGIPANFDAIKKIIDQKEKKYNTTIRIIEDCAHSLGATYKDRKVGTLGDYSFFSFGRDKVISSVFGGMIMTKDKRFIKQISLINQELPRATIGWTLQQLLHPLLFHSLILPLYSVGIGKVTIGKLSLFLLQKIGVLSKPVSNGELSCERSNFYLAKLPNIIAGLALNQLYKLDEYNSHRQEVARYYQKELPDLAKTNFPTGAIWLRFPILVRDPKSLISFFHKKGILLGNWYSNVLDPHCDLAKFSYESGSCSNAESASSKIVNLPTYPTMTIDDARRVVQLIKSWQSTQ